MSLIHPLTTIIIQNLAIFGDGVNTYFLLLLYRLPISGAQNLLFLTATSVLGHLTFFTFYCLSDKGKSEKKNFRLVISDFISKQLLCPDLCCLTSVGFSCNRGSPQDNPKSLAPVGVPRTLL